MLIPPVKQLLQNKLERNAGWNGNNSSKTVLLRWLRPLLKLKLLSMRVERHR